MSKPSSPLPLEGMRVLDFAQFLAGPAAAMRLADLGADVVKIERPQGGDLCRSLAINEQYLDGSSLLFQTFNRNKRSVAADLKVEADLAAVKQLVATADVMIHNFRPGVMERIGLDYDSVAKINPCIVYGWVTGYGTSGPWRDKPGQDLLVQSMSGLAWLQGNRDDPPIPAGLPILDSATALNLTQGILAALLRRTTTGRGGLVEADLLSTAIDLQFEPMTAYFNDRGDNRPSRSEIANANLYGAAPYGIYATADGYLAIAMTPLARLSELLGCPEIGTFDQSEAFACRNEIKPVVAKVLASKTTAEWLAVLEPADIWCARVMNWQELAESDGFQALDPLQTVTTESGEQAVTTRCPFRLDGRTLTSTRGAPRLGAHTSEILDAISPAST
ncbi:CoA transferase [Shinella sp. 838]|uniref:CaiB/BaiF CoA transferase family protein n=1 Tax=Shinella sp. 838 TaxID=3038164 RepID=UPI0024151ABE|nr:CoA transferase [Shinella sp. 838]MDG4674927.1 CoA transferase [Shinella sp. 838]